MSFNLHTKRSRLVGFSSPGGHFRHDRCLAVLASLLLMHPSGSKSAADDGNDKPVFLLRHAPHGNAFHCNHGGREVCICFQEISLREGDVYFCYDVEVEEKQTNYYFMVSGEGTYQTTIEHNVHSESEQKKQAWAWPENQYDWNNRTTIPSLQIFYFGTRIAQKEAAILADLRSAFLQVLTIALTRPERPVNGTQENALSEWETLKLHVPNTALALCSRECFRQAQFALRPLFTSSHRCVPARMHSWTIHRNIV